MPDLVQEKKGRKRSLGQHNLGCPKCGTSFNTSIRQEWTDGNHVCPYCNAVLDIRVFNGSQKSAQTATPTSDGRQAACANHAKNLATVSCAHCGVFICELCRLDLGKETLCPACFERLRRDDRLESVQNRAFNYPAQIRLAGLISIPMFVFGIILFGYVLFAVWKHSRQQKRLGRTFGTASKWFGLICGAFGALFCLLFWWSLLAKVIR